jgi:hypothetical protein
MTLICKNTEQFGLRLESLTQDKRYVAIQQVGFMVLVADDFGREAWYRKWCQKAWGFWHAFEGLELISDLSLNKSLSL